MPLVKAMPHSACYCAAEPEVSEGCSPDTARVCILSSSICRKTGGVAAKSKWSQLRLLDESRIDGQTSHSNSSRGEDGVGDSWRERWDTGFAHAFGTFGARHDVNFD